MTYAHKKSCDSCGGNYNTGDNLGGACDDGFGSSYDQGLSSQAIEHKDIYGNLVEKDGDNNFYAGDGGLDAYAAADELKARDDADAERQKQDELAKRVGADNDWNQPSTGVSSVPLKEIMDSAWKSVEEGRKQAMQHKQAMRYEDDRIERENSEDDEDY